jgi:ubiquinone/menaquinone biosynthesis C-methylase UbiE
MLERVLEPELMDSAEEARDYDRMDHSAVNRVFADDFLATGFAGGDVLDLGTGTARIPVEICRRYLDCRILATDAAPHMLDLACYNVEGARLRERIQLARVDAKRLTCRDGMFDAVISNSIVHHIPEPAAVLAEAVRVTRPGGQLFFRDLLRPDSREELDRLVATYAGNEGDHARLMFAGSLHAALTVAEMQALVAELGFEPGTVTATSDRHWTWSVVRPEPMKPR